MAPTKPREQNTPIDELVAALGDPDASEAAPDAEPARPGGDDAVELDALLAGGDATEGVELVAELPVDADDDLRGIEGQASPRLVSIVESLLFAAEGPLTVKEIRRLLREPSARQIQLALKQIVEQTSERGVVLAQVAGGFVFRTQPRNARWVQKFLQARPTRLSRPQLESLAIIAYRQPVTRPEIDHVRGVDSGAVLAGLLERDLIRIVGRKEEPGRPMLYGTTVRFLELFNLMSLRDLPDLQQFAELSEETKEQLRRKMGEDEAEALGQQVMDFAEAEVEAADGSS
jgi:segregation and condensation protein B